MRQVWIVSLTEQRLKIPDPPLLLVTDRSQARQPLAAIVAAALKAGCRWMSLREKDLADVDLILLARRLLPLTRSAGARLLLHGEASLAKLAGVDGVHLPAGADTAAARALLGPEKLIGVSIHTVIEAEAIDAELCRLRARRSGFRDAEQAGLRPGDRTQRTCRDRARGAGSGAGYRRHQRGAHWRTHRRGRRGRRGDGRRHARRRSGAGGRRPHRVAAGCLGNQRAR